MEMLHQIYFWVALVGFTCVAWLMSHSVDTTVLTFYSFLNAVGAIAAAVCLFAAFYGKPYLPTTIVATSAIIGLLSLWFFVVWDSDNTLDRCVKSTYFIYVLLSLGMALQYME